MIKILILLILNSFVLCDIYLHNPRGSNNRLDESGRERDNDRRLFDSQNNNRGGYNLGNLYYYTESKLQVEWTNQHSCGLPNANCDIILQYMCDDSARDGSDTGTIPESDSQCLSNNCDTDYRFGQNENKKYYSECKRRFRNKGLFTADQKLRDSATSTRQNPNGDRHGYECPEERDYYPYWHPSPWIDIAILTNNPQKCEYFQNESENVKTRWYCFVPNNYTGNIPNNRIDCEKIKVGQWTESNLVENLQKPICQESQFTRDNHLGNTYGGNPPVFNWTLPNIAGKRCVLRIRYNISTNDYSSFETNITNVNNNLANKMKLNQNDANSRGFIFKNNPKVQLFSDLPNFKLNLAIDTSQYGRTFQDRSHIFEIKQRPSYLQNKKIENLNVRGKRGNIVQVYPATEYDFVPNKLEISKNDFIHIQWTGSNKNPPNNDGQGVAGSDRSNMVLLTSQVYDKGNNQFFTPLELNGHYGVNYPRNLLNSSFLGLDLDDLTKLALSNQLGGSMDELDDASPYFDLGPKKITQTSSVYHYMSTRNNNFSNRDQKGEIIVFDFPFVEELLGINGGTVMVANKFELKIEPATFHQLVNIRVEIKSKDQLLNELKIMNKQLENFDFNSLASDFIIINFPQNPNNSISTSITLNDGPQLMQTTVMYRINSDFNLFTKIPLKVSECSNKQVKMDINYSGIYVARNESSYTVLIICLTLIISIALIAILVGLFLWRNPKYLERIRYTASNTKLSLSNQI